MFIKGVQRKMKNKIMRSILIQEPWVLFRILEEGELVELNDPTLFIMEPLKSEIDEGIIRPSG
jgi:hypothetical protein